MPETYVLQEGIYDDIASLDPAMIERVDGGVDLEGLEFPCVVAASQPGTVRPWCEANGIKLRPHVFYGEQVDHIIELDTTAKRQAFKRKWLKDSDPHLGSLTLKP